jgi:hypothetical protein
MLLLLLLVLPVLLLHSTYIVQNHACNTRALSVASFL